MGIFMPGENFNSVYRVKKKLQLYEKFQPGFEIKKLEFKT